MTPQEHKPPCAIYYRDFGCKNPECKHDWAGAVCTCAPKEGKRSDLEKKMEGVWCGFCQKKHTGQCEKFPKKEEKSLQLHKEKVLKEIETEFNKRYGFGIWDSRSADGHRAEGIYSSDVLEFAKRILSQSLSDQLSLIRGMVEKELEDLYELAGGTDGNMFLETYRMAVTHMRERISKNL